MKNLIVLCILGLTVAMFTSTESFAAPEKGSKKCSDGIDNDGDGDIDGADSDCGGSGVNETQLPVCATFKENPGDELGSDYPWSPYCNGLDGQVIVGGGFRLDTGLRGGGHDINDRSVRVHADSTNCTALPGATIAGIDATTEVDLQIRPIEEAQFLNMHIGDDPIPTAVLVSYKLPNKKRATLVVGTLMGAGLTCAGGGSQMTCTTIGTAGEDCQNWKLSGSGTDNACLNEASKKNGNAAPVATCTVPFAIDIEPQ